MAFDLNSIVGVRSNKPPLVVIYGEHGVGKTSWACSAPSAIVVRTEEGTGQIPGDAQTFDEICTKHEHVIAALDSLSTGDHPFRTVVIDSIDWCEALIDAKVMADYSEKERSYGKEYALAADLMRDILSRLTRLRNERGMCVILTGHEQIKRFDDPCGDSYDRHQMKLGKKTGALVQEWADVIGFATHKVIVKKEDVGFKTKKIGASAGRVVRFQWSPAYDAKCRYRIPEELPLRWDAFADAIAEATAQ